MKIIPQVDLSKRKPLFKGHIESTLKSSCNAYFEKHIEYIKKWRLHGTHTKTV